VHATNRAGGATEHLNSTILQTSPDIFWDEDRYERWLSVVSHELFHVWNVKHVRPAGIKPYDYTDENYTKLLWVAEGTTSYYDDLMLVRAGIQDGGGPRGGSRAWPSRASTRGSSSTGARPTASTPPSASTRRARW